MTSKALQAPKRRSRLNRLNGVDYAIMAFLALFALIILYPFYNALLVSLVPNTVYLRYQGLMLWPPEVTWEAYSFTFQSSLIWYGFKNSILITVIGTIYNTGREDHPLPHRLYDVLLRRFDPLLPPDPRPWADRHAVVHDPAHGH